MLFRAFAPLALLGLAACSQGEEEPDAPAPAASSTPSPAASPTPAPTAEEGTVPLAYRGVWDWTDGTCQADSDMRMEIGARVIHFYESVGTVKAVRVDGTALSLDLAMEGEGQQWRQTTELRLVEGGSLLESSLENPARTGPLRYERCSGETPNL